MSGLLLIGHSCLSLGVNEPSLTEPQEEGLSGHGVIDRITRE